MRVFNLVSIIIVFANLKINLRRVFKSVYLHHIMKTKPDKLKFLFRFFVPYKPLRHHFMRVVQKLNVSTTTRENRSKSETMNYINKYYRNEIIRLADRIKK